MCHYLDVVKLYPKVLTNRLSHLPLKVADAVRTTASVISNCPNKHDPKKYHAPSFYRAPKLTNFRINFNRSGLKEIIGKHLRNLGVNNESKINLEVKAGTNTIFNL